MLLAATNRVDVLDPALLRPGRISRRVTVPLPDEGGRAAILGVHLRSVALQGGEAAKTLVARQLAALTPGFSGEAGQLTGGRRSRVGCKAKGMCRVQGCGTLGSSARRPSALKG